MKKADVLGNPDFDGDDDGCSGWTSLNDCRECPEYTHCDRCGRGLCVYVAVNIYFNGEPDELICRHCAESDGWSMDEIATQAIDPQRGVSGDECTKAEDIK